MDREEQIKTQKEFLIGFAYWAVWGIAAFFLIKFVGPVLLPFIAAFLVAWMVSVPVDFIVRNTHLSRNILAVFFVILFYAIVIAVLYFAGYRLVGFVQDIFRELTVFFSGTVMPMLQNFFIWMNEVSQTVKETSQTSQVFEHQSAEVIRQAEEVVSEFSGTMLTGVSNAAKCIPGICMNLLISVIATVFMELEFPSILNFLQSLIPIKWKKTVQDAKDYAMGTIGKCILSYGFIFGMTLTELFIGFLVLGIDDAFVLAFIIAVLDILPVLGTGMVLIPWTMIGFAAGNFKMGMGILILYLIITVVRNIVEPKLVGRQMGLSPVVMLPCMLLGLKFLGIIGLIGLPLGVAFLKSLSDRGIIHIFDRS